MTTGVIWLGLTIGLLAVSAALLLWLRRTARRPLAELSVAVHGEGISSA